MLRSDLTLKWQTYHLLSGTGAIGQVDEHSAWIPDEYDVQKIFFMFQQYGYRPLTWNDLDEVTNQNWWSSVLEEPKVCLSWKLQHKQAIMDLCPGQGPLWPDLFGSLDFSIAFQWKVMTFYLTLGHRIRRSWIGMHFVMVHGLRLNAEFQNPYS